MAAGSPDTTSMLVAGFGVVGTLLAALLTQWAAHRHEERRWQREDRTRWHQERRECYLRFLVTVDRVQAGLRAVPALPIDGHGPPEGSQLAETSTLLAAVGAQENELFERLEEIKLLGSPAPVDAAARVFDAFKKVKDMIPADSWQPSAHAEMQAFHAELQTATSKLIDARRTFRSAAREELGIETPRST